MSDEPEAVEEQVTGVVSVQQGKDSEQYVVLRMPMSAALADEGGPMWVFTAKQATAFAHSVERAALRALSAARPLLKQ